MRKLLLRKVNYFLDAALRTEKAQEVIKLSVSGKMTENLASVPPPLKTNYMGIEDATQLFEDVKPSVISSLLLSFAKQ